jgi:GrpB-like predicted nucleotidyltransferase (UPF0157 family)
MKPHRPYTLKEYDPAWKETFNEVSNRVKDTLGGIALKVEHIGSTSIEGMVAKPQIDILVIVKDLELMKTKHQEMVDAGFTHHGRGYVNEDDDYFSLNTDEGKRIASIHILQEGNPKIDQYLLFRDYLRAHPEERDLYIGVKRDLYSKHSDNYADYDGGKKDIILEIRERATNWFNTLKD